MKKVKILGICGSIRKNSSSHVVLNEAAAKLPPEIAFELFEGLAGIPAFDGSDEDPQAVLDFKNRIREAEAVIICTPEYAFGVPGALKNAIDWTVGSGEFVDKPLALITASSQGEKGHESMKLILTAISAALAPETNLLISFVRAKVKDRKIIDPETENSVAQLMSKFVTRLQQKELAV